MLLWPSHHLSTPVANHRIRTPLSSCRWGQSRFCFRLLTAEPHAKPLTSCSTLLPEVPFHALTHCPTPSPKGRALTRLFALRVVQRNAVFTAQPSMSNWGEQAPGLWTRALLRLLNAVAVLKASSEQRLKHLSSFCLRKGHPAIGRMSLATSGSALTSSRTIPSPYSSPTTPSAPATPSRGPHRRRPPLGDLPPWSSSCGESLPLLCLK
jgi:hypothetical protein